MWHSDVREFGSERMGYPLFQERRIEEVLARQGFPREQIQLAQTQINSRAVYPGAELASSRWIKENSALCEITGYPVQQINKDKLYRKAGKVKGIKEKLENHLSV